MHLSPTDKWISPPVELMGNTVKWISSPKFVQQNGVEKKVLNQVAHAAKTDLQECVVQ